MLYKCYAAAMQPRRCSPPHIGVYNPLVIHTYITYNVEHCRYSAFVGRFLPFLVFGISILGFILHKTIGTSPSRPRDSLSPLYASLIPFFSPTFPL